MTTSFDFFRSFGSDEDVQALAGGEVLFDEGDEGHCLYVVKSGEIEIGHAGTRLAVVGAGEIFGEMALIDRSPRSARAVALSASEVVPIDEKRFLFFVEQMPMFSLQLLRTIAARLRDTNRLLG
jgi:CRP/FNR family cyclic AMP-dependent transcriptional regulator